MSDRTVVVVRFGLGFLALSGAFVGLWAGLAPRSFYDDFPGLGLVWVAVDGPYNQHLVRDVGWLNLALTLATVWAAVTLARSLVVAVLAAWLVTSLPHLAYHAANLDELAFAERVVELVTLALVPLVAGGLLAVVLLGRRDHQKRTGAIAGTRTRPASEEPPCTPDAAAAAPETSDQGRGEGAGEFR